MQIFAFLEPNPTILGQVLFLKMTTCEMKWGIFSKKQEYLILDCGNKYLKS